MDRPEKRHQKAYGVWLMTQISELLAEVRRLRDAVEGIKQLLARLLDEPPVLSGEVKTGIDIRPGHITYVSTIDAGSGSGWVCGNSMHLHRTREEARACMEESRPFRMKDGEILDREIMR
jgi:hypothetical protein